jgi:hypothetical protein
MTSCWICLDDGPDQYGKPPVRDCSCRGDDAGFAHISCIVDYARRKSIEADDWLEFGKPWIVCEHCKQKHENQLRIDLLDEFKRFVDEQYPVCNWRHLEVQNQFLMAVVSGVVVSREKQEEIIDTTLSIIDHLLMHPDPTIPPFKLEYMKADSFFMISDIRLRLKDLTEDEAMKCLGYLEEARKIRASFGNSMLVTQVEDFIAFFKEVCIERFGAQEAFGEFESLEQRIERRRNAYQLVLETYGEAISLQAGLDLANLLSDAKHTVEAWRLLNRLVATSTQHHGCEHRMTKGLEQKLADIKIPQGVILRRLDLYFKPIGYEEDKYILRGPVGVPEELKTHSCSN